MPVSKYRPKLKSKSCGICRDRGWYLVMSGVFATYSIEHCECYELENSSQVQHHVATLIMQIGGEDVLERLAETNEMARKAMDKVFPISNEEEKDPRSVSNEEAREREK